MKTLLTGIGFCLTFFLISPNSGTAQLPFDLGDFNTILMSNSDGRKDKGGGTTQTSGNNSGAGDANLGIALNLANMNTFQPKNYDISWSQKNGNGPVSVIIGDDALLNPTIIYQASVKANSVSIPFGKLNLDPSKKYFIQVKSADSKSKQAMFNLGSKKMITEAMNGLKKETQFKAASDFKKMLMKAFVMEKVGFTSDAAKMYQTYMADDKEDMILRNMKDRFEERVGL